ncbi:protein translocase subunit SecD [Dermabacteraceae bacterium P13115]
MAPLYKRPWRRPFWVLLAVIAILAGGIGYGVVAKGWQPTPKLALDLEGGTQVILNAATPDGSPVTQEQLERASAIMGQRVNALGVAETEITVQGGNNIVVDVPGTLDASTSEALKRTALMEFRALLLAGPGQPIAGSALDSQMKQAQEYISGLPAASAPDSNLKVPEGGVTPQEATSAKLLTPEVLKQYYTLNCADPAQRNKERDANPKGALVTCSDDGSEKYVLGPVAIHGDEVEDASASNETTPTGQILNTYAVNLKLNSRGAQEFAVLSTYLYQQKALSDRFAMVLDGLVISAPRINTPITDGSAQITGGFNRDSATSLAQQLKFGALPLKFTVESEQQISATLGSDQLQKGLLAGLIGLLIVVLYSVFQYRALALVTTLSLLVAGVLTYGVITVFSNVSDIGFRLSLAGVTGLIVAIGFTADSFIVYFERVRDEIRDGRGMVSAVDHAWLRARRTIIASDAVNVIAASVLYLLSVGGVRGFAFTLGLTTVIDLFVVFFFTHPMLQMLSHTSFFGGGHPMSGMDPRMLGAKAPRYAGRGRIRSKGESLAARKQREAKGDDNAAS